MMLKYRRFGEYIGYANFKDFTANHEPLAALLRLQEIYSQLVYMARWKGLRNFCSSAVTII